MDNKNRLETLPSNCKVNEEDSTKHENSSSSDRKRIIQILDLFNSKYDCKICRKKLRYKADHIIHAKLKHRLTKSEKKVCPFCKLNFKTYHQLTSHLMVDHLNEKPYGCRLCKKKFHAFLHLKRHCSKMHLRELTVDSNLSSSSLLDSSFSNASLFPVDMSLGSRKNYLFGLIDYDNSQLGLKNSEREEKEENLSNINFKYRHFLNKLRLSEIVWKNDLDGKSDFFKMNTENELDASARLLPLTVMHIYFISRIFICRNYAEWRFYKLNHEFSVENRLLTKI